MVDCASFRRYNGLHEDNLEPLHSRVGSSILDDLWSMSPSDDDDLNSDEMAHTPPMIRSLKRMVGNARRQMSKNQSQGKSSQGKPSPYYLQWVIYRFCL